MAQERDPSQSERELLDTLLRAGRAPAGRSVVHLHLSNLLPRNRTPARLRIAARLFAPLEMGNEMQIFALSGGDIIILGRDMPEAEVDRLVHRVRSLFEDDPLTFRDWMDDDDPFASWYALEIDLDEIVAVARTLLAAAEVRRDAMRTATRPPEPLAPGDLDRLTDAVHDLSVLRLMRRQPVLRFARSQANVLFEEIHVSVADVAQAIAADRDLLADRWLFQYFTRALDNSALNALPQSDVLGLADAISLNLNLETLQSAEFRSILNILRPGQRLLVEVQVIDVFTNLPAYIEARDTLRAQGHAIIIDGLSPATLGAMDMRLLDPDHVKVLWSPDLVAASHPRRADAVAEVVSILGGDRVILTRCETESAILWGLDKGISCFQGHYLDAVLAGVTLTRCPEAARCTLRQCVQRRSGMGGKRRRDCPHLPGLDMVRTFSAGRLSPRRARKAEV